ncbi:MAG: DNA-directed RNA polymerase subunit beta, partial [Clostridiales bacterium]|nr:DNA-directed RNA polymerase subunit beta [Clostridiales bacterium]
MVHPVQLGRNTRMSYSKIEEVLDMPNLIEVQKNSYKWFLEEGLREVFRDVSPISDYTGNLILEFPDYKLEDDNPKYSVEECKERDTTYSAPLKVKVRLINKETGEVKEQEIFMGDFPLMTDTGTFVINGAERVIVSQLVRSPGIYYSTKLDRTGKELFSTTVIPNRGAWLEYETDSNDVMSVRIDRTRKLPVTVLLRALGYGTDLQITELLGEDERIIATIQKDNAKSADEGLLEIYKRLRPGEPPTVDSATSLLNSLFFDPKRYDLAKFGRFKFNKKLAIAARASGQKAAENIVNPLTGEILVAENELISRQKADEIQDCGINRINILVDGKSIVVIGNNTVDLKSFVNFDPAETGITERVNYDILKKVIEEVEASDAVNKDEAIKKAIIERSDELVPKYITIHDILSSINYIINLNYNVGNHDDIDHLGNRRLRCVRAS